MEPKENAENTVKKRKISKKWIRRLILVFEIILLVFFVIGMLIPLRPTMSDLEKRKLAEMPALSPASVWDGSYFNGLSTWYADTYTIREGLLSANAAVEKLYGIHTQEIYGNAAQTADEIPEAAVTPAPILTVIPKPTATPAPAVTPQVTEAVPQQGGTETPVDEPQVTEEVTEAPTEAPVEEPVPTEPPADGTIHAMPEVAGTVFVADNRAFSIYYFNHGGADAYASMLNTVRSVLPADVTVYDMMAPDNFSVCLDANVQANLGGSSAGDAFNYINSMLDPSIVQVPVLDTLIAHNAEYVYYNTDHHWTALGAWYAYTQFCAAKGIPYHNLSDFTEVAYAPFLGTFYAYSNQSDALAANPDTVYAYIPMGTNDETVTEADGSVYHLHVVNDMTDSSVGSKYSTFIGGDSALTEIHNPAITDGSACLLIKESYGNAFAPFLVDHYQDTYIVDYRHYYGNLTQFIAEHNIKDVIFLNNADALSETASEEMLLLFF